MILNLIWRWPGERPTPAARTELHVDYAHVVPGWLIYRKRGHTGETWVPESALWEATPQPEPGDPDPMGTLP